MTETKRHWYTVTKARTAAAGVAIVLSLVAAYLFQFINWASDDPLYDPYVAVVLAREQIDFAIPAEFQKGFDSGKSQKGGSFFQTKAGRQVRIEAREDFGSVEEAERIARELADDPNCILVIGNSNSTVTAATLDVFLKHPDPPSYLLPIATATNLLIKAQKGGHDAVLRMVPDNSSQASEIQRLAASLTSGSARVAIYGDQENPLYSEDLMRDVASRVRAKGGSVILEEMIGPTNSIYNSVYIWERERKPDVLVYVGVAHHGLLLIDQLKELQINVPIIFTDGAMVGSLIENISRIPNKAFVLSPVGNKSEPNAFPTYEPIGADAYTLTSRLIELCEGSCRRASLRNVVEDIKTTNLMTNGEAGEYRFSASGNNQGMDYKVYEITAGDIRLTNDY